MALQAYSPVAKMAGKEGSYEWGWLAGEQVRRQPHKPRKAVPCHALTGRHRLPHKRGGNGRYVGPRLPKHQRLILGQLAEHAALVHVLLQVQGQCRCIRLEENETRSLNQCCQCPNSQHRSARPRPNRGSQRSGDTLGSSPAAAACSLQARHAGAVIGDACSERASHKRPCLVHQPTYHKPRLKTVSPKTLLMKPIYQSAVGVRGRGSSSSSGIRQVMWQASYGSQHSLKQGSMKSVYLADKNQRIFMQTKCRLPLVLRTGSCSTPPTRSQSVSQSGNMARRSRIKVSEGGAAGGAGGDGGGIVKKIIEAPSVPLSVLLTASKRRRAARPPEAARLRRAPAPCTAEVMEASTTASSNTDAAARRCSCCKSETGGREDPTTAAAGSRSTSHSDCCSRVSAAQAVRPAKSSSTAAHTRSVRMLKSGSWAI